MDGVKKVHAVSLFEHLTQPLRAVLGSMHLSKAANKQGSCDLQAIGGPAAVCASFHNHAVCRPGADEGHS